MKRKYGVILDNYHIALYLYPTPIDRANVGIANTECCDEFKGGLKTGTVYYLTPSAREWKSTTHKSSLGLSFDANFRAKVILSEYIPVGHWTVQDSRKAGWRYYSAPDWFTQGLQEFDAIFHTTKFNRTVARTNLFAKSATVSSTVQCCSSGIIIRTCTKAGPCFLPFSRIKSERIFT
jgi:hypothetical protein